MENPKMKLDIRPPKDPLLILEDTREIQELLASLCRKIGIQCMIADNGKTALEMMEHRSFSIYIVDLMMPVMDGRTFIRILKEREPEAIVLVETALDSPHTIIDIMKMGVFDYVVKPIDPELFMLNILKAIEYKNLKDMERDQSLNAGLKIRAQIEWLNYKENIRAASRDQSETKAIYNLKTSLTQGAGFGSLLTVIEFIKDGMKESGDSILVDREIMNMLFDNYEHCVVQIAGLRIVTDIIEKPLEFTPIDARGLLDSLPRMIKSVEPYLENRGLRVTYPELKSNCNLACNMEKIGMMFEELMINAYKYSIPGSAINVLAHKSEGYFWISVKNDIREKPYGGIPREYEKLVVEPFFRLQPPDESISKIERFGIGLGLTVVDNIIKKHNGIFMIHDVKDFTAGRERSCVLAEVLLPVQVGRPK